MTKQFHHETTLGGGPFFNSEKVPGPKCWPEIQTSDPGLKNPPLGMTKQKMRAEKTCRTQALEFQTGPHSACYGPKTFRRILPNISICVKGYILFSKRESCFQHGTIDILNEGPYGFKKGLPVPQAFWSMLEGNSRSQKEDSCSQKGSSCFQKGNPTSLI